MKKLFIVFLAFSSALYAGCREDFSKYQNSPMLIFELISLATRTCELKGVKSTECKDVVNKGHENIDLFMGIGLDIETRCLSEISKEEFVATGYQLGVLKKNLNKISVQ